MIYQIISVDNVNTTQLSAFSGLLKPEVPLDRQVTANHRLRSLSLFRPKKNQLYMRSQHLSSENQQLIREISIENRRICQDLQGLFS